MILVFFETVERSMSFQIHKILLLSIGLLVCSGCGKETVPSEIVAGKVLLNGKPFTGVAVHFYNPKVGGGAFNLNEQGEFTSPKPLPVAEYMVSLDRPGPNQGETPADIEWPEDKSGEVPTKYRSSGTSGLVARVAVGEGNHFVFEISGKAPKGKGGDGPTPFEPLPGYSS